MAGELARWTVLPIHRAEATQSNTFGSLLALGIDGVTVIFPPTWEQDVFNASLVILAGSGLPFNDLNTFKTFIRERLVTELGNSSLDTFQARCDAPNLHLPGRLQEKILYNGRGELENFFAIMVMNTKENLGGQQIIARRMGGGRRKTLRKYKKSKKSRKRRV